MIYSCCSESRRDLVRRESTLNGIDFLEVLDRAAPAGTPRQRTLLLRLLRPAAGLAADNVIIEGGERIVTVAALWAHPADAIPAADLGGENAAFFAALPEAASTLVVRTDSSGDYSAYRLRLVQSRADPLPHAAFDPPLASIDFSFKVECPTDFDCQETHACADDPGEAPDIDYLAKDYASFRRLMLDRLSLLMPDWRDRGPADLGVTLVELLAYVADHLSYRQDAIATEAYLGTARRRVSVRRHARLVDYRLHEGSNARTAVQLLVAPDADDDEPGRPIVVPATTMLLTQVTGAGARIARTNPVPGRLAPLDAALRQEPTVFETLHPLRLFKAVHLMPFYTWGDGECCLPKGAVRATLRGHFPQLAAGDGEPGRLLVFEQVLGPLTGRPEDADPARRHAVRLTAVRAFAARANEADPPVPLTDAVTGEEITEIRWHDDDALPFALCISSRTDRDHGEVAVNDVSMARGNIVLADHGRTLADEPIGTVPQPHLFTVVPADGRCAAPIREAVPPRFRPMLGAVPLTHAAADGAEGGAEGGTAASGSALAALATAPSSLMPAIRLVETSAPGRSRWEPRADLLASDASDRHFVAEIEADGEARLRFGDNRHGMRPPAGASFTATYRVGQGRAGNVGAGSLVHVVSDDARLAGASNPLPARGGTDPESIEEARQKAPFAFRTLERAVTPADYAALAERQPGVQRAAATFRWTGSWHTAFLTVDRAGAAAVTDAFKATLRDGLEGYRMAGYDTAVDAPRFVPLELDLAVEVAADYFRSNIRAALMEALGSRTLGDGRRGLFHPDNLTFAQPIYLSAIYAAAQAVPGVESVEVTRFHRQGQPSRRALDESRLDLGRLEIARLDNDRNFPERGVLRLTIGGGK
ncbi:putative baseplate assembly protein [Ancylobacter sonchi]|uniref:putative baseplate assembly protein n=1 Tax=Ancylobacter sonchi TaxID=1937790 RepID=UPI001BD4ED51|nr:putative baseplate assembly protein [Ancylobacter sonchi]MBS7533195.1 putative baseplate assembly protein [Ancylobacter sonchi]